MARHSVDVRASGMMVVTKKVKKDLGGGKLGLRQVRVLKNTVKDPALLSIMSCMASQLGGKKYDTLGDVQAKFKEARAKCVFGKKRG